MLELCLSAWHSVCRLLCLRDNQHILSLIVFLVDLLYLGLSSYGMVSIILVFLCVWFCSIVVLLSYSWFGRQVWVFNYFFLTSWNFMASPRLHHFRIAFFSQWLLLSLSCTMCFQFLSFSEHSGGARCWMLSMLPLDSRIPRHGLRVDFYVGRLFSIFIFLISCWLTLASPFSFYVWSAECCRYVLQFSCWDCVSGYCRLYLLSWLHVYMHHLLVSIGQCYLSVLLTRSMCCHLAAKRDRRIRTRRLTARPLLNFDFSSGYFLDWFLSSQLSHQIFLFCHLYVKCFGLEFGLNLTFFGKTGLLIRTSCGFYPLVFLLTLLLIIHI
jgi:hypothetical protein